MFYFYWCKTQPLVFVMLNMNQPPEPGLLPWKAEDNANYSHVHYQCTWSLKAEELVHKNNSSYLLSTEIAWQGGGAFYTYSWFHNHLLSHYLHFIDEATEVRGVDTLSKIIQLVNGKCRLSTLISRKNPPVRVSTLSPVLSINWSKTDHTQE